MKGIMAMSEKKFARLGAEYQKRKALADSCVCSWDWATKEVWHLDPLFFELNAQTPGRRSKVEPSRKDGSFEIGSDAVGRVVVERQHNEVGCTETFYDWSKDPVEVAHFSKSFRHSASPINLHLARYADGRIIQIAKSATRGASLETYHWDGLHVTKIEILHADRTEGGLQKLAAYQIVKATYASDGKVQRVAIDWTPRLPQVRNPQVVFERRKSPLVVDFRKDMLKIRAMIEGAVRRYHLGNYDPHIVPDAYSTKGLWK